MPRAGGRLDRAKELYGSHAAARGVVLGPDAARRGRAASSRRPSASAPPSITAYPANAVLRNNLAVLRELGGDLRGAEELVRVAIQDEPSLPQLSKNLGDLAYRASRYDEAWEAYRRAVELAPDLGDDVYFKLGNIAYKRNDRDLAAQLWRRGARAESEARTREDQPGDPEHPAVSDSPEERAFRALTDKITRARGVCCGAYKDRCLRRRIAVRMRARGVHTFADYSRVLDVDAARVRPAARRAHHQRHQVLPQRGDVGGARAVSAPSAGRRSRAPWWRGRPAARRARSRTRWRWRWRRSARVTRTLDWLPRARVARDRHRPRQPGARRGGALSGERVHGDAGRPRAALARAAGADGSRGPVPAVRERVVIRRHDLTRDRAPESALDLDRLPQRGDLLRPRHPGAAVPDLRRCAGAGRDPAARQGRDAGRAGARDAPSRERARAHLPEAGVSGSPSRAGEQFVRVAEWAVERGGVLITLGLGSCVAIMLHDPQARVGGDGARAAAVAQPRARPDQPGEVPRDGRAVPDRAARRGRRRPPPARGEARGRRQHVRASS